MDVKAKTAIAVVSAVMLGGAGFVVFEKFERAGIAEAATVDCEGRTTSTASALPLDLPLSEGAQVLRVDTQGATTVAFASLPGGRDDIVARRDAVLRDLQAAGYRVTGSDQEPGFEAEAQIAGPHEGTVRIKPLCTGLLEVRYKIEQ